jgi:hypothetical protein
MTGTPYNKRPEWQVTAWQAPLVNNLVQTYEYVVLSENVTQTSERFSFSYSRQRPIVYWRTISY